MEETIRLWIKDLGFPIVVAAVTIYALYKMFMLREQLAQAHAAALQKHADDLQRMTVGTVDAFTKNTAATRELSEKMEKICRAEACRAAELMAALHKH